MWFLLQWVYTVGYAHSPAGSVAYLGHVLGFIAGALVALLMRGAQGRDDMEEVAPYS
jgi:membrane associated rhomboid family serine protease